MGDVSKNISRHELACHDGCGANTMDWETIKVVQGMCDYFADKLGGHKVTLRINSAYRCLEYNRSIGSTDGSQHPRGRAMDCAIDGVSPDMIYWYLTQTYPDKYGFGLYRTFVHIDTRTNGPARWES
jgi:uncharacterized protein YcbK (DUF882 family)